MPNKLIAELMTAKISGAIAEASSYAGIEHSGTQGRLREIVLTNLIKPLIPPNWKVTTGILCSSDDSESGEAQSGQEDLIIYDPSLLPSFFSTEEQSIVPVEAVLATIEVKSTLSLSGIRQATLHAKKIRGMESLWEHKKAARARSKFHEKWRWPFHNVFALNTDLSVNGKTEWERMKEVHATLNITTPQVHSICVVGRSSFIHARSGEDFTHEEVKGEEHEEVFQWLLSVVDFMHVTHIKRTESMCICRS